MRPLFLGALLSFSTAFCAQADSTRITVVADEWPPFSGAALPDKGMSLDVISAVLEQAGYEVDTRVVPWARIMEGAESGDYDVIGSLFYDKALESHLTYAEPFFHTDVQLVRRTGSAHEFTTIDALKGYSIAVGDGFLYAPDFDHASGLNKLVVTTTLQGLRMVAFDRADLTLDSVDVVKHAMQVEDPSLSDKIEVAPGVLASQGIHMAVRTDMPQSAQLVAAFNRTLEQMKQDGTLAALLDKHVRN
jgi:polar amino acid transport system substrate-binding protein